MTKVYLAKTYGYQSNCYMLVCGSYAAVIDPSVPLSAFSVPENVKVTHVLLTHGHFDHILALDSYLGENVKVYMSSRDGRMLKDSRANASALFGLDEVISSASPVFVDDGDVISIGDATVKVIATPGHTEGSLCYSCGNDLFTGDTLFCDGIGRCDLPGGDYNKMRLSLKKLAAIEGNLKIYPGHDVLTTLDREKQNNYELSRYVAQNI